MHSRQLSVDNASAEFVLSSDREELAGLSKMGYSTATRILEHSSVLWPLARRYTLAGCFYHGFQAGVYVLTSPSGIGNGPEHIQNPLSSHLISSLSLTFLQASFRSTLQRKMDPTTPKKMSESATPDGEEDLYPMTNSDITANAPQTSHPRGPPMTSSGSDVTANSPRAPHPQGPPRNRDPSM